MPTVFATWVPITIALVYVAMLFAVAYLGDKHAPGVKSSHFHALIYSLSIAVYCTSWTYFGAVGTAVENGWAYLPIYMGPALVFLFGWPLLMRIARICRQQKITSIADFIAARYQRSASIAALVTVLAVIGALPYIALQLKAVTLSLDVLLAPAQPQGQYGQSMFYVALMLGGFAILFGARHIDASEHHRGMMWAIALESAVKLVALVAIAVFASVVVLGDTGIPDAIAANEKLRETFAVVPLPDGFITTTLLAAAAIICLPRQFHVAIVEYSDRRDLLQARWVFPLYLAIVSVAVLPIAVAGVERLPADLNPDTYVLALPMFAGERALTLLAFVGGISAATGMVIVASVALATMVSNDIALPLVLRFQRRRETPDLSRLLLQTRRLVIAGITLAAWGFVQLGNSSGQLASIGLLAFAAVAQFAPALILGMYWRRASKLGALIGLLSGFLLWVYTLLLPAVFAPTNPDWITLGPLGIGALKPQAFFGLQLAPLSHGVLISVGFNTLLLVLISQFRQQRLAERLQVDAFLRQAQSRGASAAPLAAAAHTSLEDLQVLASRFIGEQNANRAFTELRAKSTSEHASAEAIRFTELLLAGSIGSASARNVVTTALRSRGLTPGDVEQLLNEASQTARFNRQLLEATLNALPQGVSVIDQQMRLVGWNQTYVEMFQYPAGMVYVGRAVEDLIRHNARRGLMGDGEEDAQVAKRMARMRAGESYRFERTHADGRVLEMRGNAMPGGGYLTTFTDITRHKRNETALREINENLENLVEERTAELEVALSSEADAKHDAEQANAAKSRFLAAASHDLLQPLNAARLFCSVLVQQSESIPQAQQGLLEKLHASLNAAENLLSGILEISSLDRGKLQVSKTAFSVEDFVNQIRGQFAPLAQEYGLDLHIYPRKAWLHTDQKLLYRIVQNFIANALRYTPSGRVVVGTRPIDAQRLRIAVWDTGPGIKQADQEAIFAEFTKLGNAGPRYRAGSWSDNLSATRLATGSFH